MNSKGKRKFNYSNKRRGPINLSRASIESHVDEIIKALPFEEGCSHMENQGPKLKTKLKAVPKCKCIKCGRLQSSTYVYMEPPMHVRMKGDWEAKTSQDEEEKIRLLSEMLRFDESRCWKKKNSSPCKEKKMAVTCSEVMLCDVVLPEPTSVRHSPSDTANLNTNELPTDNEFKDKEIDEQGKVHLETLHNSMFS